MRPERRSPGIGGTISRGGIGSMTVSATPTFHRATDPRCTRGAFRGAGPLRRPARSDRAHRVSVFTDGRNLFATMDLICPFAAGSSANSGLRHPRPIAERAMLAAITLEASVLAVGRLRIGRRSGAVASRMPSPAQAAVIVRDGFVASACDPRKRRRPGSGGIPPGSAHRIGVIPGSAVLEDCDYE